MTDSSRSNLETVFADVSQVTQGQRYLICNATYAEMRKTSPIWKVNFMERLGFRPLPA